MSCITLGAISADVNCGYLNRGGLVSKVWISPWEDVTVWPDFPTVGDGDLVGDVTSEKFVAINFLDEEGEFKISPAGENGARCAHYELSITFNKANDDVFGLINAAMAGGLAVIVEDANSVKYLMGDKLVPAKASDGDGFNSGKARTDRNQVTLNLEYYGPGFFIYGGDDPE